MRYKRLDLTGQAFGRLKVINLDHIGINGKSYWKCKCLCGNETITRTDILLNGQSQSCGCLAAELCQKRLLIHGHTIHHNTNGSPTYISWRTMRQRCLNPANEHYPDYGGRGIKVCSHWNNFANFLHDMGERPEGLTLDRINVDGDYEPSNCRWADSTTQNNNSRWNKKYKSQRR